MNINVFKNLYNQKDMKNKQQHQSIEEQEKPQNLEENTAILSEEAQNIEEIENKPLSEQNFLELEEKYNSLNDSYLRLMAEYDNYRKRTIREKADLIRNGGESVILQMLSVFDNLERAVEANETATDIAAVKEGIELIYQQFAAVLKQQGVKKIETDNADFDPALHEAITTIPASSEELKGKIIDCTQKGYLLNDKVIRFPKVVVSQ